MPGLRPLCKAQVLPLLRTSLSNWYLFEKLANKGYTFIAKGLKRAARVRESLYRHYNQLLLKRMVHPLAARLRQPNARLELPPQKLRLRLVPLPAAAQRDGLSDGTSG
jgi:hypothetical protein